MLRLLSCGALLVVFALSSGSAAAAELVVGSTHDDPFPSLGELFLKGSHGYEISITTGRSLGGRRQGGRPEVSVKAQGARFEAEYQSAANLSGEGIHANLGRFGGIDLRWVPNGRVRELSVSCSKHTIDYFFDAGAYVGTLNFRGGDAFTVAKARRIVWPYRWRRHVDGCRRREGGEISPGSGELIEAWVPEGSRRLAVYQPRPGARVKYSASDEELVGQVEVRRSLISFGRPRTLSFESSFATAEIAPPGPFTGTACFQRFEHIELGTTGSWLGDLDVDFPDGSIAPMAGDTFRASFYSASLEGLSR